MKIKRITLLSLLVSVLTLGSFQKSMAHGVQVGYCQLSNGFIRIFVEHWHGNLTNVTQAGTMNITTTYGSTTVTQNLTPTGLINNTAWNNLSGCGSSISIIGTCAGESNRYNDWVYYDFAPAVCGQQIKITLNAGNTVVLTEACASLYPVSVTATFNDNSPPVINCQNVKVQACGSTSVNFSATAIDACDPNPSITYSIASGSTFNYGTTQVTATATDNQNQSASCTFNVTVVDDIAPTAICKNISVSLVNGSASITAADIDNGSNDACGIKSLAIDRSSFSCSDVGNQDVLLTVTDNHGNVSYCTAVVTVKDDGAPQANCKNISVTLSGGTASISAADVDNGSTVSCGNGGLTIDNANFSCANIGSNTVNLSISDIYNNSATCSATVTVIGETPSCSISATPDNNTYTGGVATNLYLGYGPSTLTLTAAASGGSSFSYNWSGSYISESGSSVTFAPDAAGTYTVNCTVTNEYGCETTCSITICVRDIRASGSGKNAKVYLCHVPPGNSSNPQTLSVSVNAIASHLSSHSGDALGACTQSCGSAKNAFDASQVTVFGDDLNVLVYPNPSNSEFTMEVETDVEDVISVELLDITGKTIERIENVMPHQLIKFGSEYAVGIYMARVKQGDQTQTLKLSKNK